MLPDDDGTCALHDEVAAIEAQLGDLAAQKAQHSANVALRARLGAQAASLPPLQARAVAEAARQLLVTIEEYTAEDASRRETVVRLAARIRELKAAQALEKPSPCSVLLL